MTTSNLYEFLGVPRDATAEQINKVFREKALVLHPDKNRNDPEAAQKFKQLMQAYQILTDPLRRGKYDATLPPLPSDAPQSEVDLHTLWKETAQRYFDQSDRYSPAVDALRLSHPLLLDGEDMLVVGIDNEHANLIGYLSVTITHNHIRRVLSQLYGRPLDFRMISGTTLDDWQEIVAAEEKTKQRRANAQRSYQTSLSATSTEGSSTSGSGGMAVAAPDAVWDEIMESLSRLWNETDVRAHAQSRARFVLETLPLIARGEDLARAGGMADEVIQRQLSRAFDRAANLSTIESGVIALEYLRYRMRLIRGVI